MLVGNERIFDPRMSLLFFAVESVVFIATKLASTFPEMIKIHELSHSYPQSINT